ILEEGRADPWEEALGTIKGPIFDFVLQKRELKKKRGMAVGPCKAMSQDTFLEGLSISKPNMISLLEQGKEPWMVEREMSDGPYADWESWYEIKELPPKWYINEEEISQRMVMERLTSYELECSSFRKAWKYEGELEQHEGNQERHFRQMTALKEISAVKIDSGYNNSKRSILLKSVLLTQQRVPTVEQ
ncbi:hypothetical protein MC885_008746, partial [Smutsia gigantea]